MSFDSYDAVVFESGVYDDSWTGEATELLRQHAGALARRPVWLFSVGCFGDRHPIVGALIKKEPREITPGRVGAVTLILIALGVLGTFPPDWRLP